MTPMSGAVVVRTRARLLFPWVLLLLGALLCAFGMLELQQQIEFSAKGVSAPGKVVDFTLFKWRYLGASADFNLAPADATPVHVRVEHASSMRAWEKGMTLNIVCAKSGTQGEICQVDAFADRWLRPTLLLSVGLSALLWGGLARLDDSHWR